MARIKSYSKPCPDNPPICIVNVEAMIQDAICVLKTNGCTLDEFAEMVADIWHSIEVYEGEVQ